MAMGEDNLEWVPPEEDEAYKLLPWKELQLQKRYGGLLTLFKSFQEMQQATTLKD